MVSQRFKGQILASQNFFRLFLQLHKLHLQQPGSPLHLNLILGGTGVMNESFIKN